jgi:hypothetical protein
VLYDIGLIEDFTIVSFSGRYLKCDQGFGVSLNVSRDARRDVLTEAPSSVNSEGIRDIIKGRACRVGF